MINFVIYQVENIVGKGENAPFPTIILKGFDFRVVTSHNCVVED